MATFLVWGKLATAVVIGFLASIALRMYENQFEIALNSAQGFYYGLQPTPIGKSFFRLGNKFNDWRLISGNETLFCSF